MFFFFFQIPAQSSLCQKGPFGLLILYKKVAPTNLPPVSYYSLYYTSTLSFIMISHEIYLLVFYMFSVIGIFVNVMRPGILLVYCLLSH